MCSECNPYCKECNGSLINQCTECETTNNRSLNYGFCNCKTGYF